RRLNYELGIKKVFLHMALPEYRYRCERDGIVENEICPVLIGKTSDAPQLNPDEVEAIRWISWPAWLKEVKIHPENYSFWCVEETQLLEKSGIIQDIILSKTI
ncbi:MAG: isopentenyl-diphosphate Delta-isomerase, partial [Patescibacteria group bacterium]